METILKSNSQDTQVSVLMINDQGIMLSVKGNDYFISYNRIPWMKNACISDALDVQMSGRNAIEWSKLDVDLEIESLKHPERYPLIMKRNDQEGTIMLSKRRVDAAKGWEILESKVESQDVLTGKVTEAVKGGVIVIYNDVRVFIPASQATATRDESLEDLVGKEVQFRLIEVSQRGRRKRAIGSIRSVLKEQRAAQREEFWKNCEIGKKYTGVVKSLTSYGAFVDLGGVFGMIHISELSWTHIKHPSEVVNVGDTVEVYVKDINEETKKISLGFKNADENPWEILKNQYPVGTVVKATIVGLTSFGAFANIIPGIDGLIHISQIANKRIEKPADVLSVGETVEAKITAIDFDKKRVSLSMRALLPEDEQAPAEATEEVAE